MAIGTTNIGFSTIATEVGLPATNLKLSELTRQQVIINPTNSRQTYTLTDTLTLNAEDSTVADNVNLASAPDEVSEFKSYTQTSPKFSAQGANQGDHVETLSARDTFSGSCFTSVLLHARLYCQRVSNDLVWYVDKGTNTNGTTNSNIGYKKEGTGITSSISSPLEVARLAGVGSSVTIATSVTTLDNTTGQVFGSIATGTTGLTGTGGTLASTNSKYGINYSFQGLAECVPSPQQMNLVYLHKTDVTVSGKRVRQFQFHVALKSTYSTNVAQCC